MGRRNTDKTVAPSKVGGKKLINIYLTPELHKRFKRWCEDQDRGMSDVIREGIIEWTDSVDGSSLERTK